MASGEYLLRLKLSLLHKDSGIVQDVVRAPGGPSPLTALITELLGVARGAPEPDADYIGITHALRSWQRPPLGGPQPDA